MGLVLRRNASAPSKLGPGAHVAVAWTGELAWDSPGPETMLFKEESPRTDRRLRRRSGRESPGSPTPFVPIASEEAGT
jgi:hypothetical protein